MAAYANLHIAFEQMRVRALRSIHGSPNSEDDSSANADPPRVLVLGPENSGKTTVCKILINYAVRAGQDWSPMLINVDPSEVSYFCFVWTHFYQHPNLQGGWSIPGTISAALVHSPLPTCSPANPLGSAATTAPTTLSSNALLPLVYWYGHPEPKKSHLLMERLIRNLGENVNEKYGVHAEGDPPVEFPVPGNDDQISRLI
jgi:polyribonucleotide 5'-hydroxyl-kinase